MFRFRRQNIADQVSSSLQNLGELSEPDTVKRSSKSDQVPSSMKNALVVETTKFVGDEGPPSRKNSPDKIFASKEFKETNISSKPQEDLPSLEECLYGLATRCSPFIPESECSSQTGETNSASIDEDIELNSRWTQDTDVSADLHDIDLAILRKLCSQGSGIPEEEGGEGSRKRGICHRGVAWRVLLEQLPVRDIHKTWPNVLPPQRKLYWELVEKHLEEAIDPGSQLKGESHWEQILRMDSSSNNGGNSVEDNQKTIRLDSPAKIRATEDIYDLFPPHSKYKELWLKAGITLNQGESAAAVGMNRLIVPRELLSTDSGVAISVEDEGDEVESEQNDSVDSTQKPHANSTNASDEKRDDLFAQFCKDAKLLSEIRKDVVRTNPHLRFYLETRNRLGIRRHAALERILFVWAKLNGNLYVQGMNEIVGTIYYVLAMDPTSSTGSSMMSLSKREHFWADHAEADTYFLFDSLLNKMEVRDVFVADLDHDSNSGLHARIKNIEKLLKEHDPEIYNHLKVSLGLDTSFYAIRWLTTLLSREFRLPDTIRLWDSMLASTHKENFLRYVCAAMVMAVRDRLLCGDFGTCLKLLQNYPSGDIGMDELLESSRALWIYETQVSLACQKGGISLKQALNMISPPEAVIMAFGRLGGKPPKLSEQIRKAVTPTSMKKVMTPTTASSLLAPTTNNMGKFMGRLWGWKTPPNDKEMIDGENIDPKKIDCSDDDIHSDDWDIIDCIIEGKTEFNAGNMRSTASSISDSSAMHSKEFAALPTTPSLSTQRTFDMLKAADSLDDDDNIVEDFSNNSDDWRS